MDITQLIMIMGAGGGGGGNPIIAVHKVSGSITSTNTTNIVALPANVQAENSIIIAGGYPVSTETSSANSWCQWYLSNSGGTLVDSGSAGYVTFERTGTTGSCSADVTVVEFASGVLTHKKHSKPTIAGTATSATLSLGATVTTSRACVIMAGFMTTDTGNDQRFSPVSYLSSTTQATIVVLTGPGTGDTLTIGVQEVEFSASYVNNVQTVFYDATNTSTSIDVAITSVNTARCLPVFNGAITAGSSVAYRQLRASLLDSTTVRLVSDNTSSANKKCSVAVIEFIDGTFLNQTENQEVYISSTNTTATDTITASAIGSSIVSFMGVNSSASSGATPNAVWSRLQHDGTTNTTVNAARGTGTSFAGNGVQISYHVSEANV